MALVEKLGTFYLGKEYDIAKKKLLDDLVYYDARDLTTHAVTVGMTGSGKTGLCIGLLEEAALDKVPAIIVDPKGDLTNLLLTFPDLLPEDFQPWVNPDDAARKDMMVEAYAEATAKTWREGLAAWDQGPDRIRALKAAADFAIYTPASDAGVPISILSSFKAPTVEMESELFAERVGGTVSALLGLMGIEADPMRSREYILLTNIVDAAWREGKDLAIQDVIKAVQKPPFAQLGVMDLETFYPEKDRFELAMLLNNLIASPGFAQWLKGAPLDIGAMLFTPDGKPRHCIFYIAHLSDAERMFFVTLLFEQVILWMRGQQGTSSLRALLYMDEVMGYLPPSAQPPSKKPLLTLLKQARAFGLGVVLSTQNPVDLDYKALSNAGTWFIGKLQTERDKARLMEGLQSLGAQQGPLADPKKLDRLLSSLDSRVFLLHSVHEPEPVVFQTRWVMSYLAGPLTRPQIKQLMAGQKEGAVLPAPQAQAAAPAEEMPQTRPEGGLAAEPPVLPPGVDAVFLPVTVTEAEARGALEDQLGKSIRPEAAKLVYRPAVLGSASVRFADRAGGVDSLQTRQLLLPVEGQPRLLNWRDAIPVEVDLRRLPSAGESGASYDIGAEGLPDPVQTVKKLSKDLGGYLSASAALEVGRNAALKLQQAPGESAEAFAARCMQAAREKRDAAVDALRVKYEKQLDALEDKIAREQAELEADKAQYQGRIAEEALSGASAIIGALGIFGRKRRANISSAASKRRMSETARARVAESEEAIARYKEDMAALEAEMKEEIDRLGEEWDAAAGKVETAKITPRASDIDLELAALAWAPYWWITYPGTGGSRTDVVPAYPVVETASS
jgi:hypothetical protein